MGRISETAALRLARAKRTKDWEEAAMIFSELEALAKEGEDNEKALLALDDFRKHVREEFDQAEEPEKLLYDTAQIETTMLVKMFQHAESAEPWYLEEAAITRKNIEDTAKVLGKWSMETLRRSLDGAVDLFQDKLEIDKIVSKFAEKEQAGGEEKSLLEAMVAELRDFQPKSKGGQEMKGKVLLMTQLRLQGGGLVDMLLSHLGGKEQ